MGADKNLTLGNAGSAVPAPPARSLSIIIPVFDQPEMLVNCLVSIRGSSFTDYEVLVSDDGSRASAFIRAAAARYGALVVHSRERRGSAAARNLAASKSRGTYLVFLDADVTVHEDTLELIAGSFDSDDRLDAVIGSYDRQPTATGATSQFRNLLHACVHERSNEVARTFWTGCGGIKREKFFAIGGFDESYKQSSVEDVEFGMRLNEAGGQIRLLPQIKVTHHKAWTLASMVHTDFFSRAIPWTALVRCHGLPTDLSFRMPDRAAAVLSAVALLAGIVALLRGPAWWFACAFCLCAVGFLQRSTLLFFRRLRGLGFALRCFPLLVIYDLVCIGGLVAGLIQVERRRDRWFGKVALACLSIIAALQWLGGAWRGEFTVIGDESRHFISGLLLYDYLTQLPLVNPLAWAGGYYLHYPLVSIGHWPPVWYLLEAGWWLLFSPSRHSTIVLNAALALGAALMFYRLVRQLAPSWMAFAGTALLIACPVVQQSFDLTMADLLCLLWGVLLMGTVARLVRHPEGPIIATSASWIIAFLLTKGTGACLIPVPALALLIAGKWKAVPARWIAVWLAAILVGGLGWYAISWTLLHPVLRPIGVSGRALSHVGLVADLAGYGVCALACCGVAVAGVRRRPASIAAIATLFSTVATSFVLREMAEPRHWIIVVPALLILSVEFLLWLDSLSRKMAVVVAIAALTLFPFRLFRQNPEGISDMVARIRRPARVMVSSDWDKEGAWIAAIALSEQRPGSVVIRASQALAVTGLKSSDYRLLTSTHKEVEQRLDELGVEIVGLRTGPQNSAPHEVLLAATLRQSSAWRECGNGGTLLLYCRLKPALAPRKPLEINLPRFALTFHE